MTTYPHSITDLIQQRFSCRKYSKESIPKEMQQSLTAFMQTMTSGPFDTPMRFELVEAGGQDGKALRSFGTYGFIQNPNGYVVGALKEGEHDLEEFGYRMEQIVLAATDLGLGTCWLGGTFMKSVFARKIGLKSDERMPAILAIGLIENEEQARAGAVRKKVAGEKRIALERLFFDGQFGNPMDGDKLGDYKTVLEMVRVGPSASNKQPWRVVKQVPAFHFYLQRTLGYRSLLTRLVQIDDMQRLDMGIAMCHFELTANELGLAGEWVFEDPGLELPDDLTEYSVTWRVKEG
jgi:hypothetical protein